MERFGSRISGVVPELRGLNLFNSSFIYPNEMQQGDTKRNMAGANMLTLTDSTFDREVLNSDVPVLVDFWAEWCGPCRMMEPTIEAIAADYAGKIKVGKLNVDDNGATAMRFNIRGIPTLLLFKDGRIVDQRVGAVGKAEVQKMLEAHIA